MTSDNKDRWIPCLNIRRIIKIKYNNFYKTRTIQIQPYWTNLIEIQIPTKTQAKHSDMYFYQIEIGYHYIYTFGIINYLHVFFVCT